MSDFLMYDIVSAFMWTLFYFYVASKGFSWYRPLRRTLVRLVQHAARCITVRRFKSVRPITTSLNFLYFTLMHFIENKLYHIYNQGNNKQQIFFSNNNYSFFLNKYKQLIAPHVDTLAYCLMPNHFHFLVNTNEKSVQEIKVGSLTLSALSNGIRLLLSSYATAINKQQNSTGSLFRQKTKSKNLENGSVNYVATAFHYIHQNPLEAGLGIFFF